MRIMRLIRRTTRTVRLMITLAIILIIISGVYLIYPKRDNMAWNSQINEMINRPDFECDFDSDCEWTHVGCYCATYGACVAKGYKSICLLPMGQGHFCEVIPPPENCICIDNKCMTIET